MATNFNFWAICLIVSFEITETAGQTPNLVASNNPVSTGGAFTLTCTKTGFTTEAMIFATDSVPVYSCPLGGIACDDSSSLPDYSQVDWTVSDGGSIQISNADPSRDSGSWTCTVGGTGTSADVIISFSCQPSDLTNPSNGGVTNTGIAPGSTATYSCNTGYTLSGSDTRTCQTDGSWSGSAPTCVEECQPSDLTNPSNGGVTNTGIALGSTATYTCNTGYTLSGSATRTCQTDGSWSGSAPTCVEAVGGPPVTW